MSREGKQCYRTPFSSFPLPLLPRKPRETLLAFSVGGCWETQKNPNSCQLGRDGEGRSTSIPWCVSGLYWSTTAEPRCVRLWHTGHCNRRGHLLTWVILSGRKDPSFYQLSTSQETCSSPLSCWGTLASPPPPPEPTKLCSSVQC